MHMSSNANVVNLSSYRKAKTPPPEQQEEWHVEVGMWILDRCRERQDIQALVNDREMEFVASMTRWPGLPTERQAWWLEKIEAKVLRALSESSPSPAA
jgi:hypothetical protein